MTKKIKEGSEVICNTCGKKYIKDRKKGHKGSHCNSCCSRKKEKDYKDRVSKIIGDKCCYCGYDRCKEAIEYHHIEEKEFNLSSAFSRLSIKKLELEAMKCIPFCANCHREFHYGFINYSEINLGNLKGYQKEILSRNIVG